MKKKPLFKDIETDFLRSVFTDRNKDSYTKIYVFQSGEILLESSRPIDGDYLAWFRNGSDFKRSLWNSFNGD